MAKLAIVLSIVAYVSECSPPPDPSCITYHGDISVSQENGVRYTEEDRKWTICDDYVEVNFDGNQCTFPREDTEFGDISRDVCETLDVTGGFVQPDGSMGLALFIDDLATGLRFEPE